MGKSAVKKTAAPRAASKPLEGVVLPEGAKLPQDHKDKATPKANETKVVVRDQEWTIQSDALDDFELLDDLNALDQRDDPTRMPSVLRRLLGDEQWKAAMGVLRDEKTGRVSVTEGSQFVMELIQELNPNSSGS